MDLIKNCTFNFLCLALSFALIQILNEDGQTQEAMDRRFYAPPPEYIEHFTLGFRESVADSLWIRWIQDGDQCVLYKGVEEGVPKETHGEFANPRHKICDNSWSFKMLDAVTKTSPRFKMPYEAGAITLSVLAEDYKGSTIIFDRGIAQYPNDWTLLYRAAYHFLYDQGDLEKAAQLLNRAAANGAPEWLRLLAARLYSKTSQIELGLQSLESYRKLVEDKPEALARVDKRIADLRQKLAEQSRSKEP